MTAARGALPLLFGIDVEPDASHPDRAAPGGWDGYEAAHRWLSILRHVLQERSGLPVHYCWYLRMDQQVADLYGSVRYVADRYHRLLDESIQQGDEVGLHPHVHRWDRRAGDWLVDLTDHAWMEDVTERALLAFQSAFGRPCRTIHFGSAFTQRLLAMAADRGVRFDVSARPGQFGYKRFSAGGISRGRLPSFLGMPTDPYRPSRVDFKRPGAGDHLEVTMIPLTVAPLSIPKRGRGLLQRLRYGGRTWFREWTPRVALHMIDARDHPNDFDDLLNRAFSAGVQHLAFVSRSDFAVTALDRVERAMYLLLDHARGPFAFSTPQELIGRLGPMVE